MHEDPNDVADLLKPTGAPSCFTHRPCTAVARVLFRVASCVVVALTPSRLHGHEHVRTHIYAYMCSHIHARTYTLAHAELEQALAQARAQHGKNKSKSNGNGMNGNGHGGGSRHRGADDGMEDIQVVFEEPFTSSGGKQFLIVLYILHV